MAEGFALSYSEKALISFEVASGGTNPEGYVSQDAIEVMKEMNIDISSYESTGITPEKLLDFDVVITMGCADKDVCPSNFGGVNEDWGIDDPHGKSIEFFRETRDIIREKVRDLIQRIS
jgi:protein-tyrosine-phosphatase